MAANIVLTLLFSSLVAYAFARLNWPGREFCFSVLVHDPDGTGLRDWGEHAGLWPGQRKRLAWCVWGGVKWSDSIPFDGKIEWGLCSSKH